MFGQGRLEGGTSHASDGGDGAGEDEQGAGADGGVADVAEHVEDDGGADDGEVEVVAARVPLRGAASTPADEAGDERDEDEEDGDAAGVDDGDEDAGFEVAPAEHVFGVDDDDGHGAHGHAEDGGVDCREEDEVAAECVAGAFAGRVEDVERGEEVGALEGADEGPLRVTFGFDPMLFSCRHLPFL